MSKLILPRNISGILPPYMLTELARRNPTNLTYLRTLSMTQTLWTKSPARDLRRPFWRLVGASSTAKREVYDAQNREKLPGKRARFEDDPETSDQTVNNAYDYSGIVRDFLWNVHNRNGINANGMVFRVTVHYGDGFGNAFWDGSQFTAGDGDGKVFLTFVLLDVFGHEVIHGVTEFEANTRYYGQSGALNESFSDVGGESIEQYHLGQTADAADWLVGKGIFTAQVNGKALRNMIDPGSAYDDPAIGKDPQPGHMDEYVRTSSDNGGVHINSGIPNKAFALFAQSVGGNAWEEPGKIWYAARVPAGEDPSFAQFAQCTMDACTVLYPKLKGNLKDAWSKVGIKPSATAIDTITPGAQDDEDVA
jgi:Zn-dependent metalloprotease